MTTINDLYSAHHAKRAEISAIRAKIEEHERLIDKHNDAIRRLEKKEYKLRDRCSWTAAKWLLPARASA